MRFALNQLGDVWCSLQTVYMAVVHIDKKGRRGRGKLVDDWQSRFWQIPRQMEGSQSRTEKGWKWIIGLLIIATITRLRRGGKTCSHIIQEVVCSISAAAQGSTRLARSKKSKRASKEEERVKTISIQRGSRKIQPLKLDAQFERDKEMKECWVRTIIGPLIQCDSGWIIHPKHLHSMAL